MFIEILGIATSNLFLSTVNFKLVNKLRFAVIILIYDTLVTDLFLNTLLVFRIKLSLVIGWMMTGNAFHRSTAIVQIWSEKRELIIQTKHLAVLLTLNFN